MATSAPNTTPDPRPTGDLEHLFRQKFADAEVAPRAGLWEQLDTELLVEQNNTYRRKLSVHRWVAAACLLLLLSISGWAVLRQWHSSSSTIAGQRAAATDSRATIAAKGLENPAGTAGGVGVAANGPRNGVAAGAAEGLAAASTGVSPSGSEQELLANAYNAYATLLAAHNQRSPTGRASQSSAGNQLYQGAAANIVGVGGRYADGSTGSTVTQFTGNYFPTEGSAAGAGWNGLLPRFANLRGGWVGARPDTLKALLLAVPQPNRNAVAAAPDETQTSTKQWRRLRLGGSLAVAAYNPNINFSHNDGRVQADDVTNALRNYYQDDAEVEYRRNLRAGMSQRVALTAAYSLNQHWTLTSGVEATQQRATSATSYGFIDGRQVSRQVADLFASTGSYSSARPTVAPTATRKTSYRYRTVAVPVEIRYGSTQPGTSLYAKVGAAVGLLLGSRSELDGSPEATRTYSLTSTDSPYRQVQTSVRGGAGVRYQPANASWNLVLGPTAEMGLTTLNANPSQRVMKQSRPYSVGLEASVEFGNSKPSVATP